MVEHFAKWVVDIKGEPCSKLFEISVLRDNNQHGKDSFGWFGENKLMISNSGGPCRDPLIQLVWDLQVELAQKVAEKLNADEDALNRSNGVWMFERRSGYAGYRCQKCALWVQLDEPKLCECKKEINDYV